MSETSKTLGVVGMKLMGDYSASVRYKKLQVVTDPSTGDSYASKVNDNIGNALSNTTYWFPLTRTGAAVTAANNAASNANDKAALANTKAGLANDAATLANQKAGLANDAATNANDKAALANTKAGLANDAATLANQKAGVANDAATLANQKAGVANDAATLANQKAGLADEAATAANNAAQAANTAATEAGRVDIAQSKSGKIISITTTNRNNQQTTQTVTEPTLEVEKQVKKVILTATDADGETSVEFEEIDDNVHQEKMSVGTADALRSEKYVEDKVPYNFRKAICASKRAEEMLVGGTVAWNQLVQNGNFSNGTNLWGHYLNDWSVSDGILTLTSTGDNTTGTNIYMYAQSISMQANHKYLVDFSVLYTQNEYGECNLATDDWTTNIVGKYNAVANVWKRNQFIFTKNSSVSNIRFMIYPFKIPTANIGDVVKIKNINIIDLTQMFGSTIADAVYAMETATPGSGVAWFRNLFPKDYYAYDAGSLQSVQAGSKKTIGFNLWDEEVAHGFFDNTTGAWTDNNNYVASNDPTPVLPNTVYYFRHGGTHKSFIRFFKTPVYAGENVGSSYIGYVELNSGNGTFITPSDCHYVHFNMASGHGNVYHNDICINFSDPAKNGTYEPYSGHTYPLDSDLVLRGIPKLADGKLYYDGDTYESSGKITRKYGIVDLGTLNWADYSSPESHVFRSYSINDAKVDSNLNPANAIIAKYTIKGFTPLSSSDNKCYAIGGFVEGWHNTLTIIDNDYSDSAAFKTAMSGVYLVYELATPTTETANPFSNPMICDPEGTEEFVEWGTRDVAVPVGHITHYLEDLAPVLNNIPVVHNNQTNQAVASFSDGAEGLPIKQMQIAVNPVQDLHGYDYPWPGGGGKNLLPMTVEGIKAKNTVGTWNGNAYTRNNVVFTLIDDGQGNVVGIKANGTASEATVFDVPLPVSIADGTSYIFSGCPANGSSSTYYIQFYRVVSSTEGTVADYGNGVTAVFGNNTGTAVADLFIASGYNAQNLMFYPMIRLSTVSDATFEPYSNICPITGWAGANVQRSGKNLCPPIDSTAYGIDHWILQDEKLNGQPVYKFTGSWAGLGPRLYLDVGTYKFSLYAKRETARQCYIYIAPNSGSNPATVTGNGTAVNVGTTWGRVSVTFNVTKAGYICPRLESDAASTGLYVSSYQIEFGTSATDFEEYKGRDKYQISFPSQAGTVYGGTLTVNKDGTGSLVVDRKKVTFNGSENFSSASNNRWYIEATGIGGIMSDAICDRFGFDETIYSQDKTGFYIGGSTPKNIYFRISGISSVADFKTWLGTNNTTVVYSLATPVTYTLTAPQIATLLGVNNIWADTGDILSVDYPADTKLYINKQIAINSRLLEMIITANHEEAMKATKAYAADDLLIVNGKLYKASTSIANGATLTVGTNITATTVAAEIAALA